jgi:HEAT repeat protein
LSTLGDFVAELSSGDDERAERASIELSEHGPTAIEALKPLLQSDVANDRWWATRALATFSDPAAGELLLNMLDDADLGVCHCAALSLSQHPRPSAIPKLIATLASEEMLLARLAGDALVANGAKAVQPLIAGLDSLPPNGRIEAARALALIADNRAIPALFTFLDSDSIALQHWANEGLDKMGLGMSFFKS